MTLGPARCVIVDIEGTTTALSFVHELLFPFAAARMAAFVSAGADQPEVRQQLDAVAAEVGQALSDAQAVAQLQAWMAEDRKVGPLKALQGMLWAQGYASGELKGHVYPDAVAGLRRWHAAGMTLAVYSSGSVQAQQLLFGHSTAGDLRPLFSAWFDTGVGHKREPDSYRRISAGLPGTPQEQLFLSDIVEELNAARAAGLQTGWLLRDGEMPSNPEHPVFRSFDDIQCPCI